MASLAIAGLSSSNAEDQRGTDFKAEILYECSNNAGRGSPMEPNQTTYYW